MNSYERSPLAAQGRLLYPGNLKRAPLLPSTSSLSSSSTSSTSLSSSCSGLERNKRKKKNRDIMSNRSVSVSASFSSSSSSSLGAIRGEVKKEKASARLNHIAGTIASSTTATIATSKSTMCLYHLTFLTFMILTLVFLIITIGASESENEEQLVESSALTGSSSSSENNRTHAHHLTINSSLNSSSVSPFAPPPSFFPNINDSNNNNNYYNNNQNGNSISDQQHSSPSQQWLTIAPSILNSVTKKTTAVTKNSSSSQFFSQGPVSQETTKLTDNVTAILTERENFYKHTDPSPEQILSSSSNPHFSSQLDHKNSNNNYKQTSKYWPDIPDTDTSNGLASGQKILQREHSGGSGNNKIRRKDQINSEQEKMQNTQPSLADEATDEEDWVTRMLRNLSLNSFRGSNNNVTNNRVGGVGGTTKQGSGRGSRSVCRISEFSCSRGKCVPGDKYCDGVDDCGDGSDEPRFCTPCNRTYYGEWGSTYSLSLSSETISSILQSHQGGRNPLPGTSSSSSSGADKQQQQPPSNPHFVCQLAFAAAGDNFGDLVQIMFDSVNIGQFSSSMVHGCPTGSLQIFEINRPITGGQWCGSGTGYSVYFSEMSAIVLTLTLGGPNPSAKISSGGSVTGDRLRGHNNSSQGGSGGGGGGNETVQNFSKWTSKGGDTTVITSSQQQTNHFEFDFRIRYKFIPKSLAVVRYGLLNSPIERGVLVPDTYCSRVLDTCHKTRCKIQSPNYPGLYPRNVTCYYTVRQREIPPCKRVLIQVTQMKPHKVQLRSIPGRQLLPSGPGGAYSVDQSTNMDSFLAWEDCRGDRDSLIIYDGTTTNDPVLLKICGGTYIPPITSSGPAILVAFHSTAYGNPLDPKPAAPFPSPLRGFELDVGVVIVDSESADYSNHHNCSFIFISSKEGEGPEFQAQEHGGNWITAKSGTVSSPRHTVPVNTTCRYEFRGSKHEAIWVYFVAYRRDLIKDSKEYEGNCTTRLRIWDGIDTRNNALLATYCDNELPKLCDHKALQNETRLVRACTANESYISAGSRLIIEQQFMEGTALRPLHYQFNYEFVRRHAGTDGTCNRHFNLAKMKSHRGIIRTSDNVFDFGRGGRTNLTCIYTFTLPSYESLHLKILNSSFGDRPCNTLTDFETGRFVCNETRGTDDGGLWFTPSASIRLYEEIWTNLNVTSHENCVCGNSSNNPMFFFTFLGRKVHLKFTVENMKSQDSPENFFVYLEYELKSGGCRGDNHYMRTESGMISLESSFTHGLKEKPPTCEHYPWIIEAREGYSLYLRVPGYTMIDTAAARASNRSLHNGTFGSYQPVSFISTSFENRMCPTTKNRIFIYDRNNKRTHKICPASNLQQMTKKSGQIVEIFSEDFEQYESPLYPPPPPKFIIEFIGRELGSYRIQWLEVMSAKMKVALLNMERLKTGKTITLEGMNRGEPFGLRNATFPDLTDPTKRLYEGADLISSQQNDRRETIQKEVCESYCPELNACISDKLWCDGEVHCPITLSDEKSCDSFWLTISQLMSPAVYIPVAAAIVSAIVCCGLVILCVFFKRTVLNGHSLKENGDGIRVSSLDRRLERMDPHDPIS